jgi:hypothetical protein
MSKKIELQVTPEGIAALDELKNKIPKSPAEKMTDALALAQTIIQLDKRNEPLTIIYGDLEITNQRYRLERQQKFREAMAKIEPVLNKSVIQEIYDAIEVKPGVLGVSVNLKLIGLQRIATFLCFVLTIVVLAKPAL